MAEPEKTRTRTRNKTTFMTTKINCHNDEMRNEKTRGMGPKV
jgi:hypothetical protein